MTDTERFLTRWARLKGKAGGRTADRGPEQPSEQRAVDSETPGPAVATSEDGKPEPRSIDPLSLPAIESINAATDIRAFLAPGVPAEMTRAALRRAWTTDPAIRDFIGIAENQWDFAAPDSIPGFGTLESLDDLRRLVGRVIGDEPPEQTLEPVASGLPEQRPTASNPTDAEVVHVGTATQSDEVVRCSSREDHTGSVKSADLQPNSPERVSRRGHGSALPR